ncbi:MAG TPA: helix-turn-helix domain-containing protein [Pyrinomonadaceae bacterium]|jgi:excisionase family DNA binding protein|nr:helix-turn-helix domain-containing protein [Pyrinomonadaceae bacterium]
MRLLDAKEVAEILQMNVQRVYELTRRGILPSVRIGPKQIRFEETRLMQWIEHGGRLNAEGLEAKLAAKQGLGASGADSSGGRSGNQRDESSQGSALRFDELREFGPIRFVLEWTLRPG